MAILNTGFSEITDKRLSYQGSRPWFLELAITGKCNFSCSYCNRFSGDLDVQAFSGWLDSVGKVRHIQVTGGEPTVHPDFQKIIALCRSHCEVLGLSTNASFGVDNYLDLPVDMYSISLDDLDHEVLRARGYRDPGLVELTIKELSRSRYVNVGLVIDDLNVGRVEQIVDHILDLGAQDIKLSVSSRAMAVMPKFSKSYEGHPILAYRVKNFNEGKQMRGYPAKRCGIMQSDVTIVGDKHYPCLVYFREKGDAIGKVNDPNMIADRERWSRAHDCTADPICAKYCMDFKCDFNHALEKEPS